MIRTFIKLRPLLSDKLKNPLPGSKAQYIMAPQFRYKGETPQNCIRAAVSILIFPKDETLSFPLIKRTVDGGPHSGQVSFPGGKVDSIDISIENTAIRELNEEIGCQIPIDNIIGQLTELYIPVSNTLVTPFVCISDQTGFWNPDLKEVERVIDVSLASLLDHSIVKTEKRNLMNRETLIPYFDIEGEKVWGATAMILSEFKEIIKQLVV